MIEALPTDLPEKIELDVTKLKAVNDVIKVSDLKVSDKVKVLTDATYDVVKVAPLVSKEAEKMAAEAAAAQAAAAAAQAAAATAAPSAEAGGAPAGGAAPEKAATPAGSSPKAS
jgi:large subunit ribosomal protein L25